MKPMLPTLTFEVPIGDEWVYETKYDGFRAIVAMDKSIKMTSRNGKDLLPQFPEAIEFFKDNASKLKDYLPLTIDGELAVLVNPYKSQFSAVQTRGRMRAAEKIMEASQRHRSAFLAFDLLEIKGTYITNEPYIKRKQFLEDIMKELNFPLEPDSKSKCFIQYIPFEKSFNSLWQNVKNYDGEGIIAKHINSKWEEGKRSTLWQKYKNWKKVNVFITAYEKSNGYFHVAVYNNKEIRPIGSFKNGMTKEETSALVHVIKSNSEKEDTRFIYVQPTIRVEIYFLEIYEGTLREPYFSKFQLSLVPEECTLTQLKETNQALPVNITHPDKPLWKKHPITKIDYISYLKEIYPFMSPFLTNRCLTVIRYPHGTFGEAFFQKNCPEYAPDFVDTYMDDGINYIVCNNYKTFLWLGNQLAIEFHIPFQTIGSNVPSEIVIDLDPPSRKEFSYAIEAALIMKEDIIDKLGLKAFIKVSGNRGLQIYFPLLDAHSITWEDTRKFTEFVARYLVAKNEKHFTIERMKKNRGNRLYIDYVQHSEGKTIICPFSLRGNENAGVAAPIDWSDLEKDIRPDGFSMDDVIKRVNEYGDPFKDFFQTNNELPLKEILKFLKK